MRTGTWGARHSRQEDANESEYLRKSGNRSGLAAFARMRGACGGHQLYRTDAAGTLAPLSVLFEAIAKKEGAPESIAPHDLPLRIRQA